MRHFRLYFTLCALTFVTTELSAGVFYQTPSGSNPLIGYISSDDDSLAGTQYFHPDAPSFGFDRFRPENILDGDIGTFSNTYSGTEVASATGNNLAPLDFVGVLWDTPQDNISAIRLHHFLFFDGGWFGTQLGDQNFLNVPNPALGNSLNPSANQADANDVAAPTVQITTDGGLTWLSIIANDNYVDVIKPVVLVEGGSLPPPVTFEFAPQNGIDGIRLVGYGGGRSDVNGGRDEQGFIAVREFEVGFATATVPEPSSMAIFGIGALGMMTARRRRKR